jgi:hypothetical protein
MQTISSCLFHNVSGDVTPFDLTRYACSLSKTAGISIQFDNDLPCDFNGDYSDDLLGSLYWAIQRKYRKASLLVPTDGSLIKLLDDFESLFDLQMVPLLDPFVNSTTPAWEVGKQLLELLKEFYPEVFAPPLHFPESGESESDKVNLTV